MAVIWEEPYESLTDLRERAKAEIAKVVLGQERAVELLLVAALARGHVLLEGPPGSAKTLLGRATAHMLGATFKRIQFTPDTTPAELTGVNTIRAGEKVFLPGVVFTNQSKNWLSASVAGGGLAAPAMAGPTRSATAVAQRAMNFLLPYFKPSPRI